MIEGKKIILKVPEENNLEKMLMWRNKSENIQYYREYRYLTMQNQKEWFKNKIVNDDTWQYFCVFPKDKPDLLIGIVGLIYIHPVYKTAEFAITLGDKSYKGKGYGKDMLKTIIRHGFNNLNLNRIWCEVYSNNAAIDLYRNIGFKDEGMMRQTVFKNGSYHDSYILGMLKQDYEKTNWFCE